MKNYRNYAKNITLFGNAPPACCSFEKMFLSLSLPKDFTPESRHTESVFAQSSIENLTNFQK